MKKKWKNNEEKNEKNGKPFIKLIENTKKNVEKNRCKRR